MTGVPSNRVLIDLDCDEIGALDGQRCDFLLVCDDDVATYVAPIELKSGRFSGRNVVQQLQGGSDIAHHRLGPGDSFRFVPVLAYRRGVRRQELDRLRENDVTMRDQRRRVLAIRCGTPLAPALRRGQTA